MTPETKTDDFGHVLLACGDHGKMAIGALVCKHVLENPSLYVDNEAPEQDLDHGAAICDACCDMDDDAPPDDLQLACRGCLSKIIGSKYDNRAKK